MPWPSSSVSTSNVDSGSDNPALARADILAAIQALNVMIAGRGSVDGVASLDSGGLIPSAQLPTIMPTGVVQDYVGTTAPTGFVLADGRTIGSASSGATNRANADTQNLFLLLWNSMADAQAPVSGGRGASAAADWAANKTITLPDARGRATVGKDDMGGTAANRITSGGSGVTGTTLGNSGGAETHTLTSAQIPAHAHPINGGNSYFLMRTTGGAVGLTSGTGLADTVTNTSNNTGGGGAHNNVQPILVVNKIIKL